METKGWQDFYHMTAGELLKRGQDALTDLNSVNFFSRYIKENYSSKGVYTHFMVFWELALNTGKELDKKTKSLLNLFQFDIEVDYSDRPQSLWAQGQQIIANAPNVESKKSACLLYDAVFEKMYNYLQNGKQDTDKTDFLNSMGNLVESNNGVRLMNLSGAISCVYPNHFVSLIGQEIKDKLKEKTNKTWDNARTPQEYLDLCETSPELFAYHKIGLNKKEQKDFFDWVMSDNNPNKKAGTGAGYAQYPRAVNRCIVKLLEISYIKKSDVNLDDVAWLKQIVESIDKDGKLKTIKAMENGQLKCAMKAFSEYKEWKNREKSDSPNDGDNGDNTPKATHKLNQILYGPPGTGKTYNTVIYAVAICEDNEIKAVKAKNYEEVVESYKALKAAGRIEFSTFHQSYGYEEFIQGIKPYVDDGKVLYKVENGIFKQFCETAWKKPDEKYVFIIDEINRGNVSKIFGELITLIEDSKRISAKNPNAGMRAKLPYATEKDDKDGFGVPNNVYILGTMNTADRSLVQLDAALRRRFRFIEMMPNAGLLTNTVVDEKGNDTGIDLERLLTAINKRICVLIDREHQIGHSYFMKVQTLQDLREVFLHDVIPLLQEYFYESYENIDVIFNKNGFIGKGEETLGVEPYEIKTEKFEATDEQSKATLATADDFIKIYGGAKKTGDEELAETEE